MPNVIYEFKGKYRFLSNFFPAKVMTAKFLEDPSTLNHYLLYPTVEHAFQATKTIHMEERWMIHRAETAGNAKRLGKKVTLRLDWDDHKLVVMTTLIRSKFENSTLRKLLLETGDATLIEGNNWGDTFWGVVKDGHGEGLNNLGVILMKVREEIRRAEADAN